MKFSPKAIQWLVLSPKQSHRVSRPILDISESSIFIRSSGSKTIDPYYITFFNAYVQPLLLLRPIPFWSLLLPTLRKPIQPIKERFGQNGAFGRLSRRSR